MPYGPLIEAIRPRIERERAPDDLLEDVWLSELSRLLPELKERSIPTSFASICREGDGQGSAIRGDRKVGWRLWPRVPLLSFSWTTCGGPTPATLEMLDYAGKRWAEQEAPVLVLITARTEEPEVSRPSRGGSCHWAEGCP